jgi:hypothetical protein
MNGLFTDWPPDYQEQFWEMYPRRVSKRTAMRALEKVRDGGEVPWTKFVNAIALYRAWLSAPGWRPPAKHPATWLNAGCWDDELSISDVDHTPSRNGFAAVRRELEDGDVTEEVVHGKWAG